MSVCEKTSDSVEQSWAGSYNTPRRHFYLDYYFISSLLGLTSLLTLSRLSALYRNWKSGYFFVPIDRAKHSFLFDQFE